MNLISEKILLGFIILVVNNCLAAVCIYIFERIYRQGSKKLLLFLDSLYATSAGVIFGLFFLAILPTINEHFDKVLSHHCSYAVYAKNLAPLGGMVLIWLIDELIQVIYSKCSSLRSTEEKEPLSPKKEESAEIETDSKTMSAVKDGKSSHADSGSMFLVVALGAHAFFEGFGVGVVRSQRLVFTVGSAIGFHEWICIATLSHKLACNAKEKSCIKFFVMILYSSVVPFGIFIGTAVSASIDSIQLLVVLSIVGGALLFASVVETLPQALASDLSHITVLLAFAIGILLIFTFQTVAVIATINSGSCPSSNLTYTP